MSQLMQLAPHLQPRIIPRGYNDCNLEIYAHDCDANYESSVQSRMPNCCTVCNQENTSSLKFTTFWNIDFYQRTFSLKKGHYLCHLCEQCTDLNSIFLTNGETASILVSHFLRINKHREDQVYLFQQVYNLAYGLQILAR